MQIRPARDTDLTAAEDIVQRAYEPYIERIGRRPAPMDDNYAEAIAKGHVFIAEEGRDDGILGLIVLVPDDDDLLVENVAVDPVRSGEGFGRALLSHAEAVARRKRLPALRLYTNAAMHENIALYSDLGWQETERQAVNGFERVVFIKPLDQVTDMLALLGAGGGGEVLLALGEEALRTEELAERIGVYTPRTIYRYLERLAGIGVVEREEEPGVPSKVINRLTDPRGISLYGLVNNYAHISLDQLPDGRIVTHSWRRLEMLAELWQSGMLEALNAGPRTVTELAQASPGLSFHQVSRRVGLYVAAGVLEVDESNRRRRYRPTENTRRAMALVAGLAHWREQGEDVAPGSSLTAAETVRLLSASLPLVVSAKDGGKRFELTVKGRGLRRREGEVSLWAEVGPDGTMECLRSGTSAEALANGSINDWIELVVLGTPKEIRIEGNDGQRLQACLQRLHKVLWRPLAASPRPELEG